MRENPVFVNWVTADLILSDIADNFDINVSTERHALVITFPDVLHRIPEEHRTQFSEYYESFCKSIIKITKMEEVFKQFEHKPITKSTPEEIKLILKENQQAYELQVGYSMKNYLKGRLSIYPFYLSTGQLKHIIHRD